MLRPIESASRWLALGRTENCSSTAGHAAPMRTLDRISSARAIAGIWRLRRNTAGEEGGRADHGDEQQDQLGRHGRVEVGVARAEEVGAALRGLAVGEEQLVAVEEVRDGLEQHEGAGEDGEVGAGGRRERAVAPGEADAAEDVVRDERREEAHPDADEEPGQHRAPEGQREDVEADVVAEDRVGHAEGRLVEEELGGLPVALRRERGDDRDDQRDADGEQPQVGQHDGAVARDRVLGAGDGDEHRPGAVGDVEVERDQAAHEDGRDDGLHDARAEDRREHAPVARPHRTTPSRRRRRQAGQDRPAPRARPRPAPAGTSFAGTAAGSRSPAGWPLSVTLQAGTV